MKKFDKLREKYDAAVNQKAAMQTAIQQLEIDAITLEEQADQAAKEGNVPLYQEKRDAAKDAVDTAHVRKKQLEIFSELQPIEEGRDAWREYAGEYNRNFERAQKALNKAQADLLKAWLDLVDLQNEGLQIREQIQTFVGSNSFADMKVNMLPNAYQRNINKPPVLVSTVAQLKVPEYIYFLDRDLLTKEQAEMINSVVRLRCSV